MSRIFRRFFGPTPLLFGLLALLCSMPAPPALAGGAGPNAGDPCHPPGQQTCGDPINPGTGNLYEKVTDFTTAGQNPLAVIRHMNTAPGTADFGSFGVWLSNYNRFLSRDSSTVDALRGDGKNITFFPDGKGGWIGPPISISG
jgi:Domain of unknown function (DUF6531)